METADNFYGEEYYLGHYDRERTNPKYYDKISSFWKYNIFDDNGVSPSGRILDYGAGLGQVSAAVNAECYDFSGFARDFLRQKGRKVYDSPEAIERSSFDYLISSHCMEHVANPFNELLFLKSLLRPAGSLVLIVPIEEMPGTPVRSYDDNKHFYNWNFQSMTNILLETGYRVELQKTIYGPFGLSKIDSLSLALKLGKLKGNFPSILTIAKAQETAP